MLCVNCGGNSGSNSMILYTIVIASQFLRVSDAGADGVGDVACFFLE